MRCRTLYELMDLYEDDEVGLKLNSPVDPGRVLEMTMARLGPRRLDRGHGKRPARRWTVRLAVAAVTAAMSVTAWAVYQAVIEDYLVQTPTQLDAVIEDLGGEASPGTTLSLVGYQGTPEYEAYTEWEAWLAEHYGEHPMDNSTWHETPDNYYVLYGAAWQDQADALDQITAKYGVRLHESRAFAEAEDIYGLLGAKPFLLNEYDKTGGYIYNDGTFKLEFLNFGDDGTDDSGSLFVSVKGTITDISGYMGPGEYEEWSYQTASGPTVDLVLYPTGGGLIFYETESAYIHASVSLPDPAQTGAASYTRADLEARADGIDFAELSRVFGPGASFDLADAVEELDAAYEQKAQEREERIRQEDEEDYAASREIAEELGSYGLVPVPEGYERRNFDWYGMEPLPAEGQSFDNVKTDWGATVSQDSVVVDYSGDKGFSLTLICFRYYADESRTVSATAEQFEAAKAYYGPQEGFRACQVNGCPGFYYPQVPASEGPPFCFPGVMWLDQARDLVFVLDMTYPISIDPQTYEAVPYDVSVEDFFTPDEMIALAATVTAE